MSKSNKNKSKSKSKSSQKQKGGFKPSEFYGKNSQRYFKSGSSELKPCNHAYGKANPVSFSKINDSYTKAGPNLAVYPGSSLKMTGGNKNVNSLNQDNSQFTDFSSRLITKDTLKMHKKNKNKKNKKNRKNITKNLKKKYNSKKRSNKKLGKKKITKKKN